MPPPAISDDLLSGALECVETTESHQNAGWMRVSDPSHSRKPFPLSQSSSQMCGSAMKY
jgi:hypothetical protein